MSIKTAEELQRLKDITEGAGLNAQVVPPATPVTPPEQIADPITGTPVVPATPPVAAPTVAPTQLDPHAAADPYNKQAQANSAQAATLRTQAMQPQPGPQNGKEAIVAGLRNALENMGRYGAPGGYYGQEEQRSQDYQKQQAMRLSQAKELQDISEKQQGLGINAENVARQENYNQGQLAETTRQRQTQEAAQAETVRHNQEVEQQGKFGKGANGQIFNTKTGEVTHEGAATSKMSKQGGTLDGEPFFANYDSVGGKYYSPESGQDVSGRFKPFEPGVGSNNTPTQTTDANGNSIIAGYNKKTNTVTPAKVAGTDTAALTADAGKANAKNDAKAAADYQTALNSLSSMEKFVKQGSYAGDQALGDAFFNIVKPGSGARMNETQINRFMSPGPLRDKMIVWAQKLDQGQPLDPAARMDLYNTAKNAVDSKKPKTRQLAPLGGKPSAGDPLGIR